MNVTEIFGVEKTPLEWVVWKIGCHSRLFRVLYWGVTHRYWWGICGYLSDFKMKLTSGVDDEQGVVGC